MIGQGYADILNFAADLGTPAATKFAYPMAVPASHLC